MTSCTDQMFANMGVDTHIDYSRYVLSALSEKDLLFNDRQERAFGVLDTNDNGFVSAAYLHDLLTAFLATDTSFEAEVIDAILEQVSEFESDQLSFKDFMGVMLNATANPRSLPLDLSVINSPDEVEEEEDSFAYINFSDYVGVSEGEFGTSKERARNSLASANSNALHRALCFACR